MHRVSARRQTRLLPANAGGIGEAAAILRAGGLVAFPTETVYGLGAHALDADAVQAAVSTFLSSANRSGSPAGVWILLQLQQWAGRWLREPLQERVRARGA